ncbi:hypothetical protein QBC35DRAFT_542961 [Podospora australis]|uniref:SRR1-like domain-containing protein n=1 Tax=Podospora australis TaxID=1536484 RepID=A0AAN6WKV3_9PEZI|nr:hypothetical protein QBC35DRAFT_542961 [Podospora australis]
MPTIKKIEAFGCGSFVWDTDENTPCIRQHALALCLRDHFEEKQGHKVQLFAQDPDYRRIDRQILKGKIAGFKILEDPWGFIEVDEETLVISIAPTAPIRQIVADIARPAMMIWCPVFKPDDPDTAQINPQVPESKCDPSTPRLRELLKGHREHRLTKDPDDFLYAALYIRKPAAGVKGE